MYYTYVLRCADKRLYVGCTSDLTDRMTRHNKGYIDATKGRLPVKLIYYSAFTKKHKAFQFESYLKSGSGRTFIKKRLI